jgi:ABC-2 type transport system ATP-binding protein
MDEADRCSRVGLMYAGRLVICDSPKSIRDQIQADLVELYPQDWQSAHELIKTLPGVLEVQTYGESLHILVDSGEKRLPQIEKALNKQKIVYQSARIAPTRMEEAFISLIRQMDEAPQLVGK